MRTFFFYGFLSCFLLSGCVIKKPIYFQPQHGFQVDVKKMAERGLYSLALGRFDDAHKQFSWGLRYNPTSCQLNFLNGLTYHLAGGMGDRKKLELGAVGYQLAIRYCAEDPWPHYYYGLLLSRLGFYGQAETQYSLAVRYGHNINKLTLLDGYLVSSYNNGDYLTALKLIRRIHKIDSRDKYVSTISKYLIPPVLRKIQPDKVVWKSIFERLRQKKKKLPHAKKQVLLDAIIILSRENTATTTGINLLDNLTLTYGLTIGKTGVDTTDIKQFYVDTKNDTGSVQSISTPQMPFTRIITNAISIPAITYTLNLFQDKADKIEILARPSLLVEDAQKASYFSGEALTLGIQGTQTGNIQEKEIGVTLEVTPNFQKDGSIELAVTIGRQYIQPLIAGETTFQQAVQTVKDNTQTTVNLRFGETAILSSLAENVKNQSYSDTPVLGHIPILNLIFNSKQESNENNHVLVLLTPKPYISFDSDIDNRDAEQRLNKLYHKIVNPSTNTEKILQALQYMRPYREPVISSGALYDKRFLKQATDEEFEMLSETNQ